MMEIKFRGINRETGEFVYGWYTKLCSGARKYDAIISDIDGSLVEFYIHDSQTIGQFTGLKDKNGVDIYKGDILYHPKQGARKVIYPMSDRFAGFGLVSIDGSKNTLQDSQFIYEVTGNIHQHPELLNA